MMLKIISDNYSNHNLPIGATVEPCEPPEWSTNTFWYTQGGDGDEVAIDPRDMEFV